MAKDKSLIFAWQLGMQRNNPVEGNERQKINWYFLENICFTCQSSTCRLYVKFRYSEKAIEMWPILTGKNGSDLLGFNESTSQNSYLQVVII